MEISPINFIRLIYVSIVFGGIMGGFNDAQKFVRALLFYRGINKKENGEETEKKVGSEETEGKFFSLAMFFQDIVFFTIFGAGTVVINYYYNNGRFRIYAPLASLLGFLIYYLSLGQVWRKTHKSVAVAIRRFFLIFLSILFKPVSLIAAFFGKIVKKISINVYKTIAKKQKKVYNNNKVRQIMKKASFGFVEPTDSNSSIRGKNNDR